MSFDPDFLEDVLFRYPEIESMNIDDLEFLDEDELQDLIDEYAIDTSVPARVRNQITTIDFSPSKKQEVKTELKISEREYLRAENLSIKSQLADEEARKESNNSGIKSLNEGTLSMAPHQVVFATREDNRVCPICRGFEGDIYEVDPETRIVIDGPVIPEGTHINCRCRYLPLTIR